MTVPATELPYHLHTGGKDVNAWQLICHVQTERVNVFSDKQSHLACGGDTSWREAGRRVQQGREKMAESERMSALNQVMFHERGERSGESLL